MGVRLWVAALLIAAGPALADDAANPSFYLVNRAPGPISRVYATPAGLPTWGTDRLTGRPIPAGHYAAIRLPADGACVYDIRVVYATGRSDERRGLNTCALDNVTFPEASAVVPAPNRPDADPSFLLTNRSRTILNELYISATGDEVLGRGQAGRQHHRGPVDRVPSGYPRASARMTSASCSPTAKPTRSVGSTCAN